MPRQSTKDPKSEWGKYVRRAMDERGLNPRSQQRLTGIPHSTVNEWLDDRPATQPNAVKFAQGFQKDVNEALRCAGFAPLEPAEPSYDQVFGERYRTMAARLEADGIEVPGRGSAHGGSEGLKPEDAVMEIEELERVLRKLAGKG